MGICEMIWLLSLAGIMLSVMFVATAAIMLYMRPGMYHVVWWKAAIVGVVVLVCGYGVMG